VLERMRTVLAISVSLASGIGIAIAQDTAFLETRDGLSELVSRVPRGMPIGEAQRELESLGFLCQPGRSNSDFGPIDAIAAPFIYCERRETGKEGIVKRWQVAMLYAQGKVSGAKVTWNPIYP
jgi:hypothetical protein